MRAARTSRRLFSTINDRDVVVVGMARTPIGSFGGSLASLTAPKLGSAAITAAIERAGIDKKLIEEAIFGNVVSAGVGQAPTRQAVLGAGLELDTACTTINKVCASGMKSLMMASTDILSGYRNVMITGGMESMSNIPYYLPGARNGFRLGNNTVVDGLIHDGLWDVYNNQHMGMCGEACATEHGFTRQDQDEFAINSYKKAAAAWEKGLFNEEVVPITIKGKKGDVVVSKDEEFSNFNPSKMSTLKSAFKKEGTITAANASKLNDGGAAMVVVSGKVCKDLGLKPLFRVKGFGDAARAPVEFTTAPSDAIPRAFKMAGVTNNDIDLHEINEAFSVVPLVNAKYVYLSLLFFLLYLLTFFFNLGSSILILTRSMSTVVLSLLVTQSVVPVLVSSSPFTMPSRLRTRLLVVPPSVTVVVEPLLLLLKDLTKQFKIPNFISLPFLVVYFLTLIY